MPDELLPQGIFDYIEYPRSEWNTDLVLSPVYRYPIVPSYYNRSLLCMPAMLESPEKPTLKILDKDGKEHEPTVGMLVTHRTGCCHDTVSRITTVYPESKASNQTLYLKPLHSRDDHCVYVSDVRFVSKEEDSLPPEDKNPPLIDRIENFHRNLHRAINRVSSSYNRSDKNLLDKLYRIVTLYDVTNQHRWFWATVAESLDDPRKISYATSIELSDDNKKRRKCGISGFLRRKADEYGFHFTSTEAERIGYLIGIHFPRGYDYKFNILTEMEIKRAYDESPESWNSCMKGRPYVRWYSANPEKVSLVEVMLGDIYEGRALLWDTDQGTKVLDRVYPSDNGPHTIALHNLCEENGWDYKTVQGPEDGYLKSDRMDYTVTMSCEPTKVWNRKTGYPYMDTFKYTHNCLESDNQVVLSMDEGSNRLICTGGGWEPNDRDDDDDDEYDTSCSSCDAGVNEDNIFRSPDNDVLCESCFDENYMDLDYIGPNGRAIYGTHSLDFTTACWNCGDGRLNEHITTVENRPLCSDCLPNQTQICGSCGEPRLIHNISTLYPTPLCDTCDERIRRDTMSTVIDNTRRSVETSIETARRCIATTIGIGE